MAREIRSLFRNHPLYRQMWKDSRIL
ncbi:hypothetical protein Q4O60_01915 [Aeribacillus pallidus]|nr:hypothetical protein [Aeribacillus pallidus]